MSKTNFLKDCSLCGMIGSPGIIYLRFELRFLGYVRPDYRKYDNKKNKNDSKFSGFEKSCEFFSYTKIHYIIFPDIKPNYFELSNSFINLKCR